MRLAQFWLGVGPMIKEVWLGVGPLVGVIVGGLLTRAWQRKHWKLENKKQEYKETLATLVRAANRMLDISSSFVIKGEEEKRLYDLRIEGIVAIQQNVFIRKQLHKVGALEKWKAMTEVPRPQKLYDALTQDFNSLLQAIVDVSERDLS